MYETFYGLRERPFSLLPDPDYLYLSPKHLRALTLLEYGMMNQAGFSVICGDTGAGKTTLIRRLLNELGADTTVGLITNTHKSFGELLSWVLMAFGIDAENKSKAQMHQLLIEFLIDQYAQNHRTVLIVDEAQNMTADTLEELRMLSNINADKDQVLQVILAGQPALRETLRKPELMQFAQRIAVDYYLESLNRDETREYIQHRLEVAGGNPDTFTEAACVAAFHYSGGTPRLINLLCDTALVYGFAEQTHIIDAPLIEDVVREQHKNSIVPTFNKPMGQNPASEQPSRQSPPSPAAPDTAAQTTTVAEPPAALEDEAIEQGESVAQKAASDYESALHAGHHDTHEHEHVIVNEARAAQHSGSHHETTAHAEELHVSSKVTRINKSSSTKKPPAYEHMEADPAPEKTRAGEQPAHTGSHAAAPEPGETHAADSIEPEFEEEDTKHHSSYKDVYPIVHIADEPKKNLGILILGILGGMILSMLMFFAAWLMFRNEPPAPAVPAVAPQTDPVPATPNISADQAQLEAIQRERDEARAATEALMRERDAALAAAQKQEAIRAAEKRANEIIAAQERKYTNEMERIRQRAFEAEMAATKARERERIASEEAERARIEASRNTAAAVVIPQPVQPPIVTAPPVTATTPHVEEEQKPVPAVTSKTVAPAATESNTQFSANPCNSPSAKFLSTCKK